MPYRAVYISVMSLRPASGSGSRPRITKRPGNDTPGLHGAVAHTSVCRAGAVGTLSLRAMMPPVLVMVKSPTGFALNTGLLGGSTTGGSPTFARLVLILTKNWHPVSLPESPSRPSLASCEPPAIHAARCVSVSVRQRAEGLPNRVRTRTWAGLRGFLARKTHNWIEQRSGEGVRRLENTEPNESATHRFF